MITFTKDARGYSLDIYLIPKCFIAHSYYKWSEPYAVSTNKAEQVRFCKDCGKVQVRMLDMHIPTDTQAVKELEQCKRRLAQYSYDPIDIVHLQFIHDRLANVYFEDEKVDYMRRLQSIIDEHSL